MGLAASQARLLTITSRLHDVEYKAQNIMNQKVELATQEDSAYKEYCAALDYKKIQVAYNNGTSTKFIDATFDNVCKFDETGNRKCEYGIIDNQTGRMIVPQEVFDSYKEYSNDKYSFAWSMLGFMESYESSDFSWSDRYGNDVGSVSGFGDDGNNGKVISLMTDVEELVFNNHSDDSTLKAAYDSYKEAIAGNDYEKQCEAVNTFREALYSNNSYKAEIYDYMRIEKTDDKEADIKAPKYIDGFPKEFDDMMASEFEYYVRLFEGIENAGGCMSIVDFAKGEATDNDWFTNQINSGAVTLTMYNKSGRNKGWTETSIATSVNENYLKEAQDDLKIKKAEAKYEHELREIKNKDAAFDRDLNKLETERTALKTEMESIKKVKNDNIERTFGIFS